MCSRCDVFSSAPLSHSGSLGEMGTFCPVTCRQVGSTERATVHGEYYLVLLRSCEFKHVTSTPLNMRCADRAFCILGVLYIQRPAVCMRHTASQQHATLLSDT